MTAPVLILGAPYVFARQKMRKPFHAEVVRLVQQPVLCHNGCGLYYIPAEDVLEREPGIRAGTCCPDCLAPPKTWRTGCTDEIEVTVRMQFGNVSGVEFLRSLGPLAPNGDVRCRARFKNVSGDLFDPTTVTCRVRNPAPPNIETGYTYGVDSALVKESTGVYSLVLTPHVAGNWIVLFRGEGATGNAASPPFTITATAAG